MNKVILGFCANFETPQAPPLNNIFEKKIFLHLFYNSSKFLEQLLFLIKMHFFYPKNTIFPNTWILVHFSAIFI